MLYIIVNSRLFLEKKIWDCSPQKFSSRWAKMGLYFLEVHENFINTYSFVKKSKSEKVQHEICIRMQSRKLCIITNVISSLTSASILAWSSDSVQFKFSKTTKVSQKSSSWFDVYQSSKFQINRRISSIFATFSENLN